MIGEWFKKVGDDVGEGELLFSYETDKAVFEEAAKVSGEAARRVFWAWATMCLPER